MAWANSGLYPATLIANIQATANAPVWTSTANKFFLTNTSDTTSYNAALASAVYGSHSANEVTGTGWAAGGPTMATAFNGGSMVPALTVSGTSPVLLAWGITNGISVTGTTLSGIIGGYFYGTVTTLYLICGIYFGGTSYATVAGTFAVTWAGSQVVTVNCAANA
jgi:hypothetical protein